MVLKQQEGVTVLLTETCCDVARLSVPSVGGAGQGPVSGPSGLALLPIVTKTNTSQFLHSKPSDKCFTTLSQCSPNMAYVS